MWFMQWACKESVLVPTGSFIENVIGDFHVEGSNHMCTIDYGVTFLLTIQKDKDPII